MTRINTIKTGMKKDKSSLHALDETNTLLNNIATVLLSLFVLIRVIRGLFLRLYFLYAPCAPA